VTTGASDPAEEAGATDEPAAGAPLPAAYVIPRELAQATLNYLAAQPYREVFALVAAFEALEPLSEATDSRGSEAG
jgi:hypothetical protein